MGHVAIIGDVGGHATQLRACLEGLGVTPSEWPPGLHVVQVGDLFGGEPDDIEVARLVQPHLYAGRWTQLIGNWELEAVGGPSLQTPRGRSADPAALKTFARWHGAGLVRYAATVTSTRGTTAVVTHAGLCSTWWHSNAGGELDPTRVVTTINNASPSVLHYGGHMYAASPTSLAPSPVWASSAELWSSWSTESLPWPLVHGHSHTYDWRKRQWLEWTPRDLLAHATPQRERRHVRFTPPAGKHPILGIDPGLWSGSPAGALHPLVVTTTEE